MATPVITDIVNGKGYKANGVQFSLNPATNRFQEASTISPTTPAAVPTSAPKVPSPVVSASTATDKINNVIAPAMNEAQTAIANQQMQKGTPIYGYKNDNAAMPSTITGYRQADGTIIPATTEKTPEQQIAETPDTGFKFVYNPNDGTRIQIPLNETAAQHGMIDNNPTVAPLKPVLGSADLPSGTSIKQYQDGTYGMFDVSGKYIGNATETQFMNAKNGQDVLNKLNQAVNGNYPLTPNQQAQIDSIKQQYQMLIKEQETANANFTGGTTVAQNLYGIGNTMMGAGQIKGVIDAGVAKITDIQSRMNSDVSKMTQAFKDNNLMALKDAYNAFANNSKQLQDNIDKTHDDVAEIIRTDKLQRQQVEMAIDNDIRQAISDAAKGGATAEQLAKMQQALQKHDLSGAVTAGGESLLSATGIVGEYNAYKKDASSRGLVPISFDDYQTKDANRKARIAAAGASIVSGTNMTSKQQSVFNSLVDKQNKSPLVMANDRAAILKNMTDAVEADPSNAALQVSFIYSMIQALDTYQSAVREGEINLVQGTQGLGEKIGNLPSKIEQGNPLNPSKIAEYVAVSRTLTNSIASAAKAKENAFKAQAQVNGISKTWDEYTTTMKELNSTPVKDEVVNEQASDPMNLGIKKKAATNNNPIGI